MTWLLTLYAGGRQGRATSRLGLGRSIEQKLATEPGDEVSPLAGIRWKQKRLWDGQVGHLLEAMQNAGNGKNPPRSCHRLGSPILGPSEVARERSGEVLPAS